MCSTLVNSCIGHKISDYKDLENFKGIAIYYNGNETYHKDGWALPSNNLIFESFTLKEFLVRFPQFANFVIKEANIFYGEYVFRIVEGDE